MFIFPNKDHEIFLEGDLHLDSWVLRAYIYLVTLSPKVNHLNVVF